MADEVVFWLPHASIHRNTKAHEKTTTTKKPHFFPSIRGKNAMPMLCIVNLKSRYGEVILMLYIVSLKFGYD